MTHDIINASRFLSEGKIILYPTDTLWGLGCDPQNDLAIKRIISIKKREFKKAFIILIATFQQLFEYVDKPNLKVKKLWEESEQPLTIIFDNGKNVSDLVMHEDKTLAVRLVKNDFCKRLIQKFGKPILSTSANVSGQSAPVNFEQIDKTIIESVDFIVNLSKDTQSNPSRIIRFFADGKEEVIRE